jgi:hypothetical protein
MLHAHASPVPSVAARRGAQHGPARQATASLRRYAGEEGERLDSTQRARRETTERVRVILT